MLSAAGLGQQIVVAYTWRLIIDQGFAGDRAVGAAVPIGDEAPAGIAAWLIGEVGIAPIEGIGLPGGINAEPIRLTTQHRLEQVVSKVASDLRNPGCPWKGGQSPSKGPRRLQGGQKNQLDIPGISLGLRQQYLLKV